MEQIADPNNVLRPEQPQNPSSEVIEKRLRKLLEVERKGLKNFYNPLELGPLPETGKRMAERLLAMDCPLETANELTVLTLYDLAILIGKDLHCGYV
jgi:hypothetical protein